MAIHLNKEKRISWADFQTDFLSKEDAFRYEWLNGIVEKTHREWNVSWFYICRSIQNEIDENGLPFSKCECLISEKSPKAGHGLFYK